MQGLCQNSATRTNLSVFNDIDKYQIQRAHPTPEKAFSMVDSYCNLSPSEMNTLYLWTDNNPTLKSIIKVDRCTFIDCPQIERTLILGKLILTENKYHTTLKRNLIYAGLSYDGVTSLCRCSSVSEVRKVFVYVNGGTDAA